MQKLSLFPSREPHNLSNIFYLNDNKSMSEADANSCLLLYISSCFHVGDCDPIRGAGALRSPVDAQAGAQLPVLVVRNGRSHRILQHLRDDRPNGVHAGGTAGAEGASRPSHGRHDASEVPRTTTNYQLINAAWNIDCVKSVALNVNIFS